MGTSGPHFTGAHTEAVLLLSLAPHLTIAPINERCRNKFLSRWKFIHYSSLEYVCRYYEVKLRESIN